MNKECSKDVESQSKITMLDENLRHSTKVQSVSHSDGMPHCNSIHTCNYMKLYVHNMPGAFLLSAIPSIALLLQGKEVLTGVNAGYPRGHPPPMV